MILPIFGPDLIAFIDLVGVHDHTEHVTPIEQARGPGSD